MRTNMYKYLVPVGLIATLLTFQNCGKASFKKAGGEADLTSQLTPQDTDVPPDDITPDDPQAPNDPQGPNDPPNTPNPPPTTPDDPKAPCKNHDDHDHKKCKDKNCKYKDSALVACIVESRGRSVKLGLSNGKLSSDQSVAKSVCISSKACLQMVSAKFDVQGTYDRGYCKGNPNVTNLSDAEIAALLLK